MAEWNCMRRYARTGRHLLFFLSLSCCLEIEAVWADNDISMHGGNFTLYWENDTFFGTDRDYTNGLKLTWSRAAREEGEKSGLPDALFGYLPLVRDQGALRTLSYSFGQYIYIPEDTQQSKLVKDDRPYAGYSFFGLGFHAIQGSRRDILEFDTGIVGPLSMAQEVQDFTHELIDSPKARGWRHQLSNEPALDIIAESKWRTFQKDLGSGFGLDFIPHLGGHVGNVAVYANTGAEFRFGWVVPRDFGSCPIRPGCDPADAGDHDFDGDGRASPYAVYLFTSFDGRLVLHNIFLDGNTFSESHHVDKEPLVADLMAGLVFRYKRFKVSYAYVYRTREFKQQDEPQVFGAINISYSF
jgi:lipid A 3-O-deacylase